jgi:hypothetical protein
MYKVCVFQAEDIYPLLKLANDNRKVAETKMN